jgi:hypothetical protein
MMCLVAEFCRIDFHIASGVVDFVTMFTGHECLRLFPLGLLQRSCVLHHPAHCSGLQAEIEPVAEEVTGDTLRDTVDNLWFVYGKSTRSKGLILNPVLI